MVYNRLVLAAYVATVPGQPKNGGFSLRFRRLILSDFSLWHGPDSSLLDHKVRLKDESETGC
jgi:hypothetical protein